MNERIINKLLIIASQTGDAHLDFLDTKKFAELLVKEFRTLVKETYLKTDPAHRACLLVLDDKIEQHFGVE